MKEQLQLPQMKRRSGDKIPHASQRMTTSPDTLLAYPWGQGRRFMEGYPTSTQFPYA